MKYDVVHKKTKDFIWRGLTLDQLEDKMRGNEIQFSIHDIVPVKD